MADITKPGHINFFSETRCHKGLRTRSWSHSVDATSWTTGKPNGFSVELVEGSSSSWKWRLSVCIQKPLKPTAGAITFSYQEDIEVEAILFYVSGKTFGRDKHTKDGDVTIVV